MSRCEFREGVEQCVDVLFRSVRSRASGRVLPCGKELLIRGENLAYRICGQGLRVQVALGVGAAQFLVCAAVISAGAARGAENSF